jgi:hypothetical protein
MASIRDLSCPPLQDLLSWPPLLAPMHVLLFATLDMSLDTPYWSHSVVWFWISMLPESIVDNVRLNMCIKIHKKGAS